MFFISRLYALSGIVCLGGELDTCRYEGSVQNLNKLTEEQIIKQQSVGFSQDDLSTKNNYSPATIVYSFDFVIHEEHRRNFVAAFNNT